LGFYYGAHRPSFTDHLDPVITPREYAGILASALRAVAETGTARSDACPIEARDPTRRPREGIPSLSRLVEEQPGNASARRLLGVAYLDGGDDEVGLAHLEIALTILRHEAGRCVSLHQTLCARLEAALTGLALVPIRARCGTREAVRRLVGRLLAP
jgi:hypothetical protein